MGLRSSTLISSLFLLTTAGLVLGDDIPLNAPFVCNGDSIIVESCNARDLSDSSSCLVGHPDQIKPNGLMAYTNETRGALKKLLPTCKQPTPEQLAKANAFQRHQAEQLAANTKKANDELDANEAKVQSAITGKPALSPEEREANRCIASGRNPSLCVGKQLDNFFGAAMNMVVPNASTPPPPGLALAGTYEGKGSWRIDFNENSASARCATLDSQPRKYSVDVKNNLAIVEIESTPKTIVLTMKPNGTLVGTGAITINGYNIVSGGGGTYTAGQGHWDTQTTTTTHEYTPLEASASDVASNPTLQQNGQTYTTTSTSTTTTYKPGTTTYSGPGVSFIPKTATCSQAVLASEGVIKDPAQSVANNMLFGGKEIPPTPPGLRMRGTYVGQNGFTVEFYPESAVVGCGQAARAYPYIVQANGSQAAVKIEDPSHPLLLAIKADGELDPGQGSYEVHGRNITGRSANGDYTFTPLNITCNLSTLAGANANPGHSGGGDPIFGMAAGLSAPASGSTPASASRTVASAAPSGPSAMTAGGTAGNTTRSAPSPSTSAAGGAVLAISSGFAAQPGMPNPLAGHPYLLLRDSFANILVKGGVQVPAGTSPYKAMAYACGNRTPDCQKIMAAVTAQTAASVRADANGKAAFSGVAAGTYYLMISARYNNQPLVWDMPVRLKAGDNAVMLDQSNASPMR